MCVEWPCVNTAFLVVLSVDRDVSTVCVCVLWRIVVTFGAEGSSEG